MTKDEAQAAFLAANPGLTVDDMTPEDLEQYGFTPLAVDVPVPSPAVSDEQVAADAAALPAEASANSTGAQVLDGVKQVAGVAGTLLGVAAKAP